MRRSVLRAVAHPRQRARFILALLFATILFPIVLAGLVLGTLVLLVPLIALLFWISTRVFFARFMGNGVLVSPLNYPRIHSMAEQLKVTMGYAKPIYIFVYEHGSFNLYLMRLFRRRAVFLNSELLEAGVTDDEVRWLIGRFVGYLRARREAGFGGWLIHAAEKLVVFNLLILPYERALVYTGDRLALVAINGDISSAVSAMQKLLVGRQLGYSLNPEGIIAQQRQLKGTFFGLLARLTSGFPHLTARYVDLIMFAKAFFPAQYTRFAAANPMLPEDLPRISPSRQRSPHVPLANMPEESWAARAVVTVGATAMVLAVLAGFAWLGARPVSGLVTAIVRQTPFGSSPTPAPVPVAQQPLHPSAPPHTHFNGAGTLAPDTGCNWVSQDTNDLRVTCR